MNNEPAHKINQMPAVIFDDQYLCFGDSLIIHTKELLRGTSKRCLSYGMEKPLSRKTDFVIRDFEVWKFTVVL